MQTYLIIPDVHQDVEWANSIIQKEEGSFDEIIFLGDFWDNFVEKASIKETAEFIHEVDSKYKCTFLVGNHDASYYSVYHEMKKHHTLPRELTYFCTGFSRSKAAKIAKYLKPEIIKKSKLVVFINEHLISHAGVLPHLLTISPFNDHPEETLKNFLDATQVVWDAFPYMYHPLFFAGWARGGYFPHGGLIWADWHLEFENGTIWPQIVGHSYHKKIYEKDNSYCLDGNQSTYGILTNTVEIKEI